MEKINFVNKPNTDTPINDTNLNKMQDYIEEAIEKDIITCELPDLNPINLPAWDRKQITQYTKLNQLYSRFTINEGIIIPTGTKAVLISAIVRTANVAGNDTDVMLHIVKNGSSYYNTYDNVRSSKFITSSITDFLLPVKEGDVLQLGIVVGLAGNYRLYGGYLTVKEI